MAARRIGVLGATGYTGRLIVAELRRRGVAVLAAGRNPEKLRQLSADFGEIETLEADVGDRAALDRLATRSRVIINTAGPFIDYGEPVVRAAIGNAVHYLDTTGEQPFMKAMLVHDARAREEGVAVVSAQAFEVAVADCAAAVGAEGFDDVAAVQVTYVAPLHASRGTQRTMLRMLQSTGYAYIGGKWVEEAPAKMTRHVEFPAPIGRVTAVSFPSAEVITIPRHLSVRAVRTFMSVPPIAARLLPATVPAVRAVMGTPLAQVVNYWLGSGTGGPDEQTRAHDAFHIAVDVRGVCAGSARQRRVLVRGHDPYGLTAVIAAQAAVLMCRENYNRSGVLPPAAAFDPRLFLDYLKDFGLTYQIES
jgi:short subunit dehydrogenase-like uncharacterized protein